MGLRMAMSPHLNRFPLGAAETAERFLYIGQWIGLTALNNIKTIVQLKGKQDLPCRKELVECRETDGLAAVIWPLRTVRWIY